MRRSLVLAVILVTTLGVAPPAAASAVVVHGTNTVPDDLAAVQAAVDTANRVILDGVFDFGEGTLDISRNVALRGRRDATIRRGGNADEMRTTIHVHSPATRVSIRNLRMEGSNDAAIYVQETATRILHNDIRGAYFAALIVEDAHGVVVRGNRLESENATVFIVNSTGTRVATNTIAVVGNDVGAFGVGRAAVFLAPGFSGLENRGNHIRNNRLVGEMTYGYLIAEQAEANRVVIPRGGLDAATFVPPPFFGICGNGPDDPDPAGVAVMFAGPSPLFGFTGSMDNVVVDRTGESSVRDCGEGNLVVTPGGDGDDDDD